MEKSFFTSFFLVTLFLGLIFLISNNVSADLISVNSGGSINLSTGTDKYVEGFFFASPLCGNLIIESTNGEQCDDGNLVSGDGCSASCQTETASGGGGAGAGGGGESGSAQPQIVSISPSNLNINLAVNTTTERIIKITNPGNYTINVKVNQFDLGNHVIISEENFSISPGQTKELKLIFVALSEPGIFTGKVIIGGRDLLVSLNVKSKLLLFDSNIVVTNKDFKVVQGDELKTLVTLIPLGDKERLDVTLKFSIKDYRNKIYLTKSETLLVEKQTSLKRNFDTGTLPQGDYVVGLELVYPNGVAPSSAHFNVIEKPKSSILGSVILILVILIIIIVILIIIVLLIKRRKKKEEEA